MCCAGLMVCSFQKVVVCTSPFFLVLPLSSVITRCAIIAASSSALSHPLPMGRRSAKFRAGEKRFRLPPAHNQHVCRTCKFVALDGPGLDFHWLESPYCISADSPTSPAAQLPDSDDEFPLSGSDDDSSNTHVTSRSAKIVRLSSPAASVSSAIIAAGGDEEEQHVASGEYEFVTERNFPAGIDDEVHLRLLELCREIGSPLYAYDSILSWGQEAYANLT